jgi:L-ascorbate metabolism protein UlaG (beta-lactamase superfamily)
VSLNIIASGSKGNAYIYYEQVLIDVGISYKLLEPYLNDIKIILLTHSHSDHFKTRVISKIAITHPNIVWICGSHLSEKVKRCGVNPIVKDLDDSWIKIADYQFYPIDLFHGDIRGVVTNYGWRIVSLKDNSKAIHMTDTGSYEGIQALDYNIIALEANHDIDLINDKVEEAELEGKYVHGIHSRIYHASIQQAEEFVKLNATKETEVYYLHQSKSYSYDFK